MESAVSGCTRSGSMKGPPRWVHVGALFYVRVISRPRISRHDRQDDQCERDNDAQHHFVPMGRVHCWSSTELSGRLAARSRLKRVALVLRTPRRPVIDPKLLPNTGPINTWRLPVATSSRSRRSSSGVHFLLLF